MSKIDVKLIFPPLSNSVSAPPASLTALKAYLVSQGIPSVEIRDFNIEFIRYVLNNWNELRLTIEERFRGILTDPCFRDQSCRLLYISIPLVSQLRREAKDSCEDILVKTLFEIIHFYYNKNLLVDGNFLFCDVSDLGRNIDEFQGDPLLASFLQDISFQAPDLIGFSILCESQLPYALLLSGIMKTNWRDICTVAGGAYITEIVPTLRQPRDIFSTFDYLVVHEGESALRDICESLLTGKNPAHPNILSRPFRTDGDYRVEPIGQMPCQDFQDLNLELYVTPDLSLPVYSSKGCSWARCAFCSLNSHVYREKTINQFVSELKSISEQTAINHFQFVDENITPSRLRLISEAIITKGLNIRWFIQTRFDKHLDLNILHLMKQSGCYAVEFGLESGSPEVLRKIQKGISLSHVTRILSHCEQLEYRVVLNLMFGFPDETIENAEETIEFLDKIVERNPGLQLSCNTQVVKIYRASRYAKRGGLRLQKYELSTVADWYGPSWLREFKEQHKYHFVFTGRTIGMNSRNDNNLEIHERADPQVAMSKNSFLIRQVLYDFAQKRKVSEPKSYIVRIHPQPYAQIVYELNETMDVLVGQLSIGESCLSSLRKRFRNQFDAYEQGEVDDAFKSGMLCLNELGAINIW